MLDFKPSHRAVWKAPNGQFRRSECLFVALHAFDFTREGHVNVHDVRVSFNT
jgi:hypothetical protein